MTNGKIEVNVGGLAFSAEGEQEWLAEQLDKILRAAPDVVAAQTTKEKPDAKHAVHETPKSAGTFTDTLASYIKANKGDGNQVQRFLATADWLRRYCMRCRVRCYWYRDNCARPEVNSRCWSFAEC